MRVDIGDGVRLFVDLAGPALVADGQVMRERPTLLLLHGGPALDSSVFRGGALEGLTDVAQLVLYDHRGAGRSDRRSPDEWNLDTWADDVVRLCDVLGIAAPIVVGSSFGGMVAQQYLARYPGHAARVVLAGAAARLDLDVVAAAFAARGGEHAGVVARRFLGGDVSLADEYDRVCLPLYASAPIDPARFARVVANPELSAHFKTEWNSVDLRAGLAAVSCPVLVIGGELDPICPPAAVREVVDAIPTDLVTLYELAGASHLEAAGDGIAALIRSFITDPTPHPTRP